MSKREYELFLDEVFLFYEICSKNDDNKIKIIENVIFTLFRAETKHNFRYENFLLLYTAVDCCYKYFKKDKLGSVAILTFLCQKSDIDIDEYKYIIRYIADIRNEMIHEGTFLGSFFAHKVTPEQREKYTKLGVELFLRALLIRLLFKMLNLHVTGFLNPTALDQTALTIEVSGQ